MTRDGWVVLPSIVVCIVARGAAGQPATFQGRWEVAPAGMQDARVVAPTYPRSVATASGDATVIYESYPNDIGVFFRFGAGVLFADDIYSTLEHGEGGLISGYCVVIDSRVTGSPCGSEAAIPFRAVTSMWCNSNTAGPPPPYYDYPLGPVAGTTCHFEGLPKGMTLVLNCPVADVPANGSFWVAIGFDSDCAGWRVARDEYPEIGYSDSTHLADDGGTGGVTWITSIVDCFTDVHGCANFALQVVGSESGPFACCDTSTDQCSNEHPGDCNSCNGNKAFTDGVLCNDLAEPCSEAGACCDTLTGQCRAAFAIQCDGIFEEL